MLIEENDDIVVTTTIEISTYDAYGNKKSETLRFKQCSQDLIKIDNDFGVVFFVKKMNLKKMIEIL